jgi:phosphoglycolate phosphatase-like HAD superfamily hydrolase
MEKHYILFDFDGVIVDSFAPAFEVKKMICPSTTEESYKKGFCGNINDWQGEESDHDENCRHDIDFFSEYIPRLKEKVNIVQGMENVIKELSKSYVLIIISSTITAPIEELLSKFSLLDYFSEVMGNDVHTSKIEKMNIVFSKYKTTSDKCLFITDTLGDIKEASHQDVGVIAVTWGFHDSATLLPGSPYKIVDTPNDLLDAVSDYFTNKGPDVV